MIFQLLYTVFTRLLPETHDEASLEDQTARGRCVSDLSDRRALWLEPLTGSKFLN